MVNGDALRLKQILNNLVSNAVKFTDVGEVMIAVRPLGDRFRIEVRDTGIGFDSHLKEQLFQEFHQADGSNTRRHGGAGLGLAISRRCADLLGAQLDCESTPGAGSTFTLTFAAPASAGVVAAPPSPEPAAGMRALIVDDNATNRRVLELLLRQFGAECVSAEDGLQGVEAYSDGGFDVVLMDLQMPMMDGYDAIRAIRALEARTGRRRTPVIIVSANCMAEHRQAGQAAGADLHLGKPVSAAVLANALTDVDVLGARVAA
jgi:CheY-like chemotaxis protein/anti-sigma regulatory factor (Ser/Thr protein kinase)